MQIEHRFFLYFLHQFMQFIHTWWTAHIYRLQTQTHTLPASIPTGYKNQHDQSKFNRRATTINQASRRFNFVSSLLFHKLSLRIFPFSSFFFNVVDATGKNHFVSSIVVYIFFIVIMAQEKWLGFLLIESKRKNKHHRSTSKWKAKRKKITLLNEFRFTIYRKLEFYLRALEGAETRIWRWKMKK